MSKLKKTLPFIIYVTGCFVAYPVLKTSMMESKKEHNNHSWTVRDRTACMIFSLFSWGSVGAGIVVYSTAQIDFNKPAKW